MTEPEVRLESNRLKVEPGGQASVKVSITNPGTIVEGYRLTILGDAVKWTKVLPPDVSIYPKQESTSVVVFAPPSGAKAPGGVIPFGVKVQSTVDQDSRVVEGEVEVERQFGLQAVLRPVTSRGRWHGHHVLTVANWGNTAAKLRVAPSDPDAALGFMVKREVLDVPLGGMASSRISVRTRHPRLRGTLVRLPFEITCEPLGSDRSAGPAANVTQPDRPIVNGAFEQKPILTRTAVLVGTFMLAAVIAGATWLVLNPPKILQAGLLPSGPPQVPVLSAVGDPRDPTRPILLRWTPVPDVSGYNIREVKQANGGVVPVQGTLELGPKEDSVVAPATSPGQHCYQIQALRKGSPSSPWSAQACAIGGPAPDSPSPQPPEKTSQAPTLQPADEGPAPPPQGDATEQPPSSSSPSTSAGNAQSPPPDTWVASIVVGPEGFADQQAAKLRAAINDAQSETRFSTVLSTAYSGLSAQAPGAVSNVLISTPLPDEATAQRICESVSPVLTPKNGAVAGVVCIPVQLGTAT